MSEGYNQWEKFYHRFNTIFHGIVAATLLPFALVFLGTQKEFPDKSLVESDWLLPLQAGLGLVTLISIVISRRFQKSISSKVPEENSIKFKLNFYLKLKLIQFGILEIAALAALLGLYLTKDQFFTISYIVVLFIFSLYRPSYDLVVRELKISKEEEQKLKAGDFD